EMAAKLELTAAAVKYRIQRLIETGIIYKFTIQIDRKKVGYDILAFLIIYAISKTQIGSIVKRLKQFPEISKIITLVGDPDIVSEINVTSMNGFIELLKKLSQIDEIQTFKTWFIMDIIH
ncbi:MAG: Lrp/AsnC ligand binding domain-containing protein, partial [Candidatus Helarchaeota archaeon]|nr:Lrp/AsnC ligand binding domain-containing protein [Candidatus Helarchaeota archaeon]